MLVTVLYYWLRSRTPRLARGATMLEYAMLTILITAILGNAVRTFTPPLIQATLTRFNDIFVNFPN